MSESKKTKSLSLHLFFKTFFDGVKTQQESLLELQNTLLEFNIAEMTDAEGLIFENNDGKFNLKCIVSDKRGYNFINSMDDKSTNKKTDSDHIRECLFTVFCTDNFKIIVSIAEYFKKFCTFSSNSFAFIEEFKKTSFDNEENKRELVNFFEEKLESDSLRAAWTFVFLCFPKTPSEKNTDYRLLLLNKIHQSGHTGSKFHPLDITDNAKQIEKVNIADIGRSAELEEIKKEMLANNTVLVYGIGGIGKSYICRKLFWNYYDCFSDSIEYLAWIQYNGDLTQSVTSSFYNPETNLDNIRKKYENHPVIGDMFVKLTLSDKPDDKMQVIKEYFSKLEARLLVFIDNADTMTKEEKKWLNSCKCRMIITSRQKINGFYGVNINSPSPAYCKEMYIRDSRGNNWDGYSLDEEKYINKITELANYHTQTVMLIAKAQYCLGLSSEEMIDELNNTGFVLKGNDEIIDTEEYELTMAEHMTKIFNLLNITDETQLKTIRLFSLLAPITPIKKRDIKKWFELKSLSSINELVKYGWLNSSGSEYVSIHPVIADVVKYNYKPDFEFALPLINALQLEIEDADNYNRKNEVIVHGVSVAKIFPDVESEQIADFLDIIAYGYNYLGDYNNAILYCDKAIKIEEKVSGADSPNIANLYDDICAFLYLQGRYDEAVQYLIKAHSIYSSLSTEQPFSPEIHSNIIRHLDNIGLLLNKYGKYDEALAVFKETHLMLNKSLNFDARDLVNIYNNIASVLINMGKSETAYDIYRSAIENFSGTDLLYNNFGMILLNQGNVSEASNYIKEAISIIGKKENKDHPDNAIYYASLGLVLLNQGKFDEALNIFNNSLLILKKTFESNHPDIARLYSFIGETYLRQGNIEKAKTKYDDAYEIMKNNFGNEHPQTVLFYENVGLILVLQEKLNEAFDCFNRVLKQKEAIWGKDSLYSAETYSNIGIYYTQIKNYERALYYFEKALTIRKTILVPQHPKIASNYTAIAQIHILNLEYDKAFESISHNKETDGYFSVINYHWPAGLINKEKKNYSAALDSFNEALRILQENLNEDSVLVKKIKEEIYEIKKMLSD